MNVNLRHIIQQIDANQDLIASKGKFSVEVLKKINYKLRLDWNYYSNRMEGGTLTREETRSVMVGNIDVKGKPFKDVAEMNGHDKVVQEVLQMSRGELRLSERRIKDIHKAIMYEEDITENKKIGVWKKTANEIINYQHEKFDFTNPSEVPDKIHELLNNINAFLDKYHQGKAKQHPLEAIGQFHLEYLTIHPFYDGNGRTARILTNILFMSCGYPLIIIKEEQKSSYYKLLADIQVYGGDIQLLLSFLGDRILETQKIVINAIEGKEIEEPDDLDKEIAMWKKQTMVNNIDTLHRNHELIYGLYKNCIRKVFELFEIKSTQFHDMFGKASITYYINNNSNEGLDWLDNEMYNIISKPQPIFNDERETPHELVADDTFKNLFVKLKLQEYRFNENDAFSMTPEIHFNFQLYKYEIKYAKVKKEKSYGENLTQEEIQQIINTSVRAIFEEIKDKSKA